MTIRPAIWYWIAGLFVFSASSVGIWLANDPSRALAGSLAAVPEATVRVDSIAKAKPAAKAMAPKAKLLSRKSLIEAAKKAKKPTRKLSSKVLLPTIPDTLPFLEFNGQMLAALYEQANYLRRKDVPERGASGITKSEMIRTVELLSKVQLLDPSVLLTTFDFYAVNTALKNDRVRMTGYYTPLIRASRTQRSGYEIPMLRRPASDVPAPATIEAGGLAGQGLELAWLPSKKELRNAQLQGSCMVEFDDGKREHFGFGGSVRRSGGTYVFFTKVSEEVMGAGTFPLTPGYSVAVDLRYIPLGATLLAELPDLDAAGRLKGYKYRIIFAQDRGGAILTTSRMDLYCGFGQKGLQEARKINRFGRLWVMLPKEN
jgi:3D (Asp-Asp-Asp) domain-containing protein